MNWDNLKIGDKLVRVMEPHDGIVVEVIDIYPCMGFKCRVNETVWLWTSMDSDASDEFRFVFSDKWEMFNQ